jgi:hypothetical protein
MFRKPIPVSPLLGGRIHAGLAVGRSSLAFAARDDVESARAGQVLESPVEGAAIRLVAEGIAHVAARERLGKAGGVHDYSGMHGALLEGRV